MRDAVLTAQTVCYGVYISDITFGKCSTGQIRGAEHFFSCRPVFAVFIGDREILEDQLDRFDRGFSGLLRGGAADICFDRMCQGIHAGCSGKLWRQTDGNFRFQNGVVRDQAEIVDRVFVMGIGIGDDGGKGCLASGSGSGGNGDQQGQLVHDMKDAFHLGQ